MIEKLPFQVNIEALQSDFEKIKKFPITWQGKDFGYMNFGGWSVLSRDGTCEDGWEAAAALFNYCDNKPYKYHLAQYLKISHPFEHVNKTPACFGEIERLIDFLDSQGFYPRRARISIIKANDASSVHRDAPWPEDNLIDNYICRIHVPIITNKKCVHWTEQKTTHMPADGSVYMMSVNNLHQAQNNSNEDRYHLIMDAYDTKGFTKTMKFTDDINKLKITSQQFRETMNQTKLNLFHKVVFFVASRTISAFKKV